MFLYAIVRTLSLHSPVLCSALWSLIVCNMVNPSHHERHCKLQGFDSSTNYRQLASWPVCHVLSPSQKNSYVSIAKLSSMSASYPLVLASFIVVAADAKLLVETWPQEFSGRLSAQEMGFTCVASAFWGCTMLHLQGNGRCAQIWSATGGQCCELGTPFHFFASLRPKFRG